MAEVRRWKGEGLIRGRLTSSEVVSELRPTLQLLNSLGTELDVHRRARCDRLGISFVDWRRPHTFFDNWPASLDGVAIDGNT